MKIVLNIIITILVLLGLSYGITYFTHSKFIDYSFVIGMIATIIIWFFTSKGGFTSRNMDMIIQGTTGIRMDKQKYEFSPTIVFFTSLAYTLIAFATTLFHYRSYF